MTRRLFFCKMFEKSNYDTDKGVPPFDVFDMRDHKKNRDNEGDCKWRCDNNYRCARYEYDEKTLFCKLFEKPKDDFHQTEPFDVFDMRDHPKNRDHEGDCKWRCDNNDQCARYEYDAITLICKMFEKYDLSQDDKDTSDGDDNDDQALVTKKAKSGSKHNSDEDNKKSKKGFKHNSARDDKDVSNKNAKDGKGNKNSKQVSKHNSDHGEKKTKKDHDAKNATNLVSDEHDEHSENETLENKKDKQEPQTKARPYWPQWFR